MNSQISCPRRFISNAMENDGWDTNRWESRGPADGVTYFPQQFTPPRTCSYCGSVHPEDALKLMEQGWEVESATGKSYKRYLHPPGYGRYLMRRLGVPDVSEPRDYRDSTPPVKLYVMHLTAEQIDKFNQLLAKQP